jgi:hypothetical protein
LPNGKIIYLNNNKLYSCNSVGTDSTVLTPQNISINSYQFYLSGAKIILGQYPPIYIMNSDGSEFSQFNLPINTDNVTYTFAWVYSPDGKQLVYTDKAGLHLINSDGSDLKMIKDTSNRSYSYKLSFTPDGNNVVYIQNIQGSVAFDLRLYNIKNAQDTSLYYNDDGNKVGDYDASSWNKLLFVDGDGINLLNVSNYNYTFLHSGGDAHFAYDSTKITFIYYNWRTDIYQLGVMNLNDNSTILLLPNLPNNIISNPRLSLDGKRIFFQADSIWEVPVKKM